MQITSHFLSSEVGVRGDVRVIQITKAPPNRCRTAAAVFVVMNKRLFAQTSCSFGGKGSIIGCYETLHPSVSS